MASITPEPTTVAIMKSKTADMARLLAAAYSARNRKKMLPITAAVLVIAPAAPTRGRAMASWTRIFFSAIQSQPAATPIKIRHPTETHRAFTAPSMPPTETAKKGEKQMDAATGATVLLTSEHSPNTPPSTAPAIGPSRIAPMMTGI